MAEIGVYDAKTRLSELLEKVREGETFTITRHGRPIAELRPVGDRSPTERKALVERMKRFQRGHSPGEATLRELIAVGRVSEA